MALLDTPRLLMPRLTFGRAARQALGAAWPPDNADRLWQATLQQQRRLVPRRPHHSPGVNLILRYLEWDCALYRALRDEGLEEPEAGALIERVNWAIFQSPTRLGFALSRLRSAQRLTRVRWLLDLMFRLLFSAPFQRRVLPSTTGIDFDVTVCPLAAYLRAQGAPELTRHAACSLDHAMARDWGLRLERRQTLAEGDTHCDFRFRVVVAPPE